ncbi:molybdopterin-guanine dinucleotide biosynthesis protein B [Virgibacillus sp. W0181]|uniref:molybdopterin-guanine dinucleotide biosynthesis protein B n=1 Tax=Virgibacillus sp. W0181 TaxID=3391581 RepID=UPI003F44A831
MQQKHNTPIFQIVGYKGSGKTTVMMELIRYLSNKQMQVGTIKHHGHGGEPEIVQSTDSYYHSQAGAKLGGVQGETTLQLIFNQSKSMTVDELVRLYSSFSLDVILIEGYKQAAYPKIVLLRQQEDTELLEELHGIVAVASWDDQLLKPMDLPNINLNMLHSHLPFMEQLIFNK